MDEKVKTGGWIIKGFINTESAAEEGLQTINGQLQ